MNLLSNVKLRKVSVATVAGTSAVTSDQVDTAGFMSATFFTTIGTANAGNYIKIQQDETTGMASAADLEGSKVIAAADADIVAKEITRPQERFLRAVVTRGASTTVGDIYCILSGPARTLPVDNNVDDEIVSEISASPDEGTA